MKKLISIMLALVFVFSMATVAFATETTPSAGTDGTTLVANGGTFTISKEYVVNGTAPKETFTFTVSKGEVKDGDANTAPDVGIGSVEFDGELTETKTVTVQLPTYTNVGEYRYTISENESSNAGVTTQATSLTLVVYVLNGDNGLVCKVALKDSEGNKVDGFTGNLANKYESGSLAVKKIVTGNLGDTTKDFNVTVTFTNTDGASVISYVDGVETKTITFVDGKAEAEISLKHNETITFTNIPAGTTYTVAEADYTADGYKASYVYSDEADTKTINADDADTVQIENNKNNENVDTGISLDSVPFILILAVCAGAAILFVTKRRSVEF